MKKDIFIEFDEKPNSINPLMFSDFNSKILNSLMFERLVDGKNCKIDIFNNYREYKVSFYDSLLSNHIYPIDYLRTILYQLKNNSYVYVDNYPLFLYSIIKRGKYLCYIACVFDKH